MKIIEAALSGKHKWNSFIHEHYPPIGVFMQTWEWGEFQKNLGRATHRYYVVEGETLVAAFTLVHHSLPFGRSYGYAPRGPVIIKDATKEQIHEVFNAIRTWAGAHTPHHLFIRLEPPLESIPTSLTESRNFFFPSYYIQPRYNLAIPLHKPETDMVADLHPSTRSNLNRAERRGVTVTHKAQFTPDEYTYFNAMMKDTIARNSGTNAYPSAAYFAAFLKTVPPISDAQDPTTLSLGIIQGYQHNKPAATHLVLYFGKTATYLYGAAHTNYLSSKVTTYLHWQSALEAKRRGLEWYDIGGIDETRWPSLTTFKRQFRGTEFSYIGNIDIPINLLGYQLYTLVKKWRM